MRTLLALLCFATPATALAYHDPWTGPDKVKHFEVSFGIAAGGYGVAALLGGERETRILTGAVLAGTAGLGKEALDLVARGDPSYRDLAWDGLGIGAGLLVTLGIDALVTWALESSAAAEP